jgi:hypothetical protein
MVSTSGLAFVLMFVVGLSIGLVSIKDRRSQVEEQTRVQMPKFGGLDTRQKEGPWPACLGMNGEDCLELIASYAKDLHIELIHPYEPSTNDFRPDRVRIFVDDSNVVTTIPNRG